MKHEKEELEEVEKQLGPLLEMERKVEALQKSLNDAQTQCEERQKQLDAFANDMTEELKDLQGTKS